MWWSREDSLLDIIKGTTHEERRSYRGSRVDTDAVQDEIVRKFTGKFDFKKFCGAISILSGTVCVALAIAFMFFTEYTVFIVNDIEKDEYWVSKEGVHYEEDEYYRRGYRKGDEHRVNYIYYDNYMVDGVEYTHKSYIDFGDRGIRYFPNNPSVSITDSEFTIVAGISGGICVLTLIMVLVLHFVDIDIDEVDPLSDDESDSSGDINDFNIDTDVGNFDTGINKSNYDSGYDLGDEIDFDD